jgi:hypothetical protein
MPKQSQAIPATDKWYSIQSGIKLRISIDKLFIFLELIHERSSIRMNITNDNNWETTCTTKQSTISLCGNGFQRSIQSRYRHSKEH